jgi:Zn-dependent protease
MKYSWRIASVAGVGINVHWSFSFIILWMGWQGAFGNHELKSLLFVAVALLLLFGCIALHELGHALTALRLRVAVKDIIILPVGGLAQIQSLPKKPHHDFLIAAAGPAVNLTLAIGAIVTLVGSGREDLLARFIVLPGVMLEQMLVSPVRQGLVSNLIMFLLLSNMVLFVFNLFPAFPMDGGRMVRAVLATLVPYPRATQFTMGFGQTLAMLVLCWALQIRSLGLILLACFVLMAGLSLRHKPLTRSEP